MYDVIVIGGGAAGMMASAIAAEMGRTVLLLEKNAVCGRKLAITGKGRCNVTNHCSPQQVIENIPNGGRFLYSALNAFAPEDVISYFESIGVPLKTERGNRVFPVSDQAKDIVSALERHIRSLGVTIRRATAGDILTAEGSVIGVKTQQKVFQARNVILATGGLSYPGTGSTGDGYTMARRLGHDVSDLNGSLVPLVSSDSCCAKMQGLSLKNVSIAVFDGGKKPIYNDFGEMLFTHFGVSGPIILSASAHMRTFDKNHYSIQIDLKPALDEKKLDERILRDFEKYANRDFANALSDLVHKKMIPVIIERCQIDPATKVHSVTRPQRLGLVQLLKHFTIEITGKRPVSEAVVTSGGVSLKQIDPKTMQSKLVRGLYFAGEILDADAYTGGFNLQIAWSTAYAAARHLIVTETEL